MNGQPYIQYRYVCRRCGEYDYFYRARPRRPSPDCHFCRGPVIKTAECSGLNPWFVAYGARKPKRSSADWMMGGRKNANKGKTGGTFGRPKKHAVNNQPYHAETPSGVGPETELALVDDDSGDRIRGDEEGLLAGGVGEHLRGGSSFSAVDGGGREPGTGVEESEVDEAGVQQALAEID